MGKPLITIEFLPRVFYIAWKVRSDPIEDDSTWFAADPTLEEITQEEGLFCPAKGPAKRRLGRKKGGKKRDRGLFCDLKKFS